MRHPQIPVQIQEGRLRLLQELYRLVVAAPHSSVQSRRCRKLYAREVFALLRSRYGIPDMTRGQGLPTEIQLAIQAEIPVPGFVDMIAEVMQVEKLRPSSDLNEK